MSVLVAALTIFFVMWLQGYIYSRLWMKRLFFDISFSDKTAFEGGSVYLYETIINKKALPLPMVALKFQISKNLIFSDTTNSSISDDYYRNDLYSILMFQKITRRLPFKCGNRGYYTIKSVDIVSSNILSSSKLVSHFRSDAALTVYPKLIGIDDIIAPYKNLYGSALTKRFINPDPFEFKGIREYQPYDSFKNVNFKATAKTGQLMVNMNDYTVSQEVCIILNLQEYSTWSSDYLYEHTIRLAASLSAYYIGEGVPLRFISNGRDTVTGQSIALDSGSGYGHLTNIYEALARISLQKDRDAIKESLNEIIISNNIYPIYILISTYNEKDICECYEQLKETGADTLWIIPVYKDTPIRPEIREDIVKWEVVGNEQV